MQFKSETLERLSREDPSASTNVKTLLCLQHSILGRLDTLLGYAEILRRGGKSREATSQYFEILEMIDEHLLRFERIGTIAMKGVEHIRTADKSDPKEYPMSIEIVSGDAPMVLKGTKNRKQLSREQKEAVCTFAKHLRETVVREIGASQSSYTYLSGYIVGSN